MATIDIEILNAAKNDGVFAKPLNRNQERYCHRSIRTAWRILKLIQSREELGIGAQELSKALRLNHNTVKIYLRWFREVRLVEWDIIPESGAPIVYFKNIVVKFRKPTQTYVQ
jgi:response regulator of citrate/malate metabolism